METKSMIGMLAVGVVGVSLFASQVSALTGCDFPSGGWNNAGFNNRSCPMGTLPNGLAVSARASSLSGTDPNTGGKGVIAELKSLSNVPSNVRVRVFAQGWTSSGPISSCLTGDDTVAGDGATVGDGTGCQNAIQHVLTVAVSEII